MLTLNVRALAAAAALLTAVPAASAAAASATGTTATATRAAVPGIDAANTGWSQLRMRPRLIVFGLGGAPFVTDLRWLRWTGTEADGAGRLYVQRPCSRPSYRCPVTSRPAEVRLYLVKAHAGRPYFARMTLRFAGRAPGRLLAPTLTMLPSGFWSSDRAWPSL